MIVATRLSSAESWWWFELQSMLDTDFSEVLINFYVREGEEEGGLSSIVNIELYPVSSSWLWGIAVSYHLWNFRVLKNLTNKPQPSSSDTFIADSGFINMLFPRNELQKYPFFSSLLRKVFHIVPFHGIIKLIISFIFKTKQTLQLLSCRI